MGHEHVLVINFKPLVWSLWIFARWRLFSPWTASCCRPSPRSSVRFWRNFGADRSHPSCFWPLFGAMLVLFWRCGKDRSKKALKTSLCQARLPPNLCHFYGKNKPSEKKTTVFLWRLEPFAEEVVEWSESLRLRLRQRHLEVPTERTDSEGLRETDEGKTGGNEEVEPPGECERGALRSRDGEDGWFCLKQRTLG